jgi:glutamate carboxypeptidase
MRRLVLACLCLLPGLSPQAQLSPVETRLVAHIEAGAGPALTRLEQIVNLNSGTLNLAGVREVGALLTPAFTELGFDVQWLEGAAWQRAGHLVARRAAAGGPRVLLIGHLDTVFEPDSPFQRFELLEDGRVKGPGVLDMKGGIVIMLQALAGLAAVDALDALDLTVF